MLDADLATLYQVSTRTFNQAVKRNSARFPADFMFQLSEKETENLRSQSVTSSWGGRRYRPYAFTEHGVAMLSAVLHSGRAVETSVMIVRAFIALREMIAANKDLAARVEKLESSHRQTASIIDVLVDEIENVAHEAQNWVWSVVSSRARHEFRKTLYLILECLSGQPAGGNLYTPAHHARRRKALQ
jgi:methyl-accepting chemotaxis protein